MAEMATYVGVTPRTVIATNVAIGRGLRVVKDSSGTVAVAGIGVRGDYVTIADIEASKPGMACSMADGAKVPAVASEACAVGDDAYSAASGKFSKTSTNAVYCGRWSLAASADGVLGEVELASVE